MPQPSTLPALYPVKKMGEQPATQKQSQVPPRSARSSGTKANRPSLVLQPISRSQPVQPATPDPLGQVSTGGLGGVACARDASTHLDSLLDEISYPGHSAMLPTSFSKAVLFGGGSGGPKADAPPASQPLQQRTSAAMFARAPRAAPVKAARTFTDIASIGASKENTAPPAAGRGPELVSGRLMSTQFSALGPDHSGSHSQRSTQTASTAAVTQIVDPPPSRRPPLDLSLKTQLTFTSDHSFEEVEAAGTEPGTWVGSMYAERPAPNRLQRYRQALQTFQFPHDCMDQADCRSSASTKSGAARLRRRREDWDTAFHCLYSQLRDGECDAFYYVSPQGTRRCAFTVLFRAAGVGGCAAVSAVVGHSTSALRALLREEGVRFTMPLAPQLREDPLAAVALADVEACNAGKAVVRDRMAELDGRPASALIVSGELAVGGLYQVLDSCGGRLYEESCDVPLLLAPLPFAAASLQALQPEVIHSSLRDITATGKRQRTGMKYKVQLRGLIPPWVADRLVQMLAIAQQFDMALSTDTAPHSGTLNMPTPPVPVEERSDRSEAPDANPGGESWKLKGYVSREEWDRWHSPQTALSGQTVVGKLEYCPASRRVQAHLKAPRTMAAAAAVQHAWQQC